MINCASKLLAAGQEGQVSEYDSSQTTTRSAAWAKTAIPMLKIRHRPKIKLFLIMPPHLSLMNYTGRTIICQEPISLCSTFRLFILIYA